MDWTGPENRAPHAAPHYRSWCLPAALRRCGSRSFVSRLCATACWFAHSSFSRDDRAAVKLLGHAPGARHCTCVHRRARFSKRDIACLWAAEAEHTDPLWTHSGPTLDPLRTHSASARRKTTVCTIRRCPRHTGVPRCQVPRVYRAQVPGWNRTASSRAYSFRRKAAISGSVASKCLREDDIRHSYGDGTDAMALQHTAGMRRVEAVPWCTVDEPLRFRSVSDGRVPCHPRHAQQCRRGV